MKRQSNSAQLTDIRNRRDNMKKSISAFIAAFVAPILGFLSVYIPVALLKREEHLFDGVPFYGITRIIFDNLEFAPTIMLLFIAGCLLGYLGERIWWLVGILTMIAFPISAIYEMKISPTSHNLWPFEFALYGVVCIPAIVGAFIGSKIYIRMAHERKKRTKRVRHD